MAPAHLVAQALAGARGQDDERIAPRHDGPASSLLAWTEAPVAKLAFQGIEKRAPVHDGGHHARSGMRRHRQLACAVRKRRAGTSRSYCRRDAGA